MNFRTLLAILFFLIVINVSVVVFKPQQTIQEDKISIVPSKENTVEDAIKSITSTQLKTYVEKLSSKEFDGRLTGTTGNNEAAKYISEKLSECGLNVEYQPFDYKGRKTQNICAWINGESDQIIIIGAHYDHVGKNHLGADDNASGTAVVMEVAKACSLLSKNFKKTIVFQLYSAEEYGLIGSKYYVQHPTFPKSNPNIKKCVFMLNLDMVGYLKDIPQKVTAYPRESSPDIKGYIDTLSAKYPFANSITNRGGGGSDQTSFLNAGVPTVWLFTGMHKNYHKTSDTYEKLNYDGMEQISKYAFELLLCVDKSEKCIEFNFEGFNPIEKGLDHNTSPFLPDKWD